MRRRTLHKKPSKGLELEALLTELGVPEASLRGPQTKYLKSAAKARLRRMMTPKALLDRIMQLQNELQELRERVASLEAKR